MLKDIPNMQEKKEAVDFERKKRTSKKDDNNSG